MNFFLNFFKKKASNLHSLAVPTRLIRIYQIVYNDITRKQRDPGFEPLENANSEEPNWYEYWPIRKFLHTVPLDESTLYGFFSPSFHEKTRLSADNIIRFIKSSADADVYAFSPFPCHGASFLNVFEHKDFFFRGFIEHGTEFFERLDRTIDVRNMINHSGNTIFSNFFCAKPRFWREWLRICDQLYEETKDIHILNSECTYTKTDGTTKILPAKVFAMECVASYLLARSKQFSCISFPSNLMPVSRGYLNLRSDITLLDDLKRGWQDTGRPELIDQYRLEQRRVLAMAWPGREVPSFDPS